MNTRVKLYTAVATALLLTACGGQKSAEESLNISRTQMQAGDFASARVELLAAASANPAHAELRLALAEVQLKTGNFASAEKEALEAEELGLAPSRTQPILAEIFFRQSRSDDLIALDKNMAADMSPADEAKVLALAAQGYLTKFNFQAASDRLEDALELSPNSVEAMTTMSGLAWLQRQPDKALEWAEKATSTDAGSADAWAALAGAYKNQGQAKEALQAYSKAIELRSYPDPLRADRALLLIAQESYSEARADIETLEQSGYKNFWYVGYVRGRLEYAEGDYANAALTFNQVLNKVKAHGPTTFYAALANSQLGNYEQARLLATEAVGLMPQWTEPAGLLAEVMIKSGDTKEGSQLIEKLLEADPNNITALRMLGQSYLAMGKFEEGIATLEHLLSISPEADGVQQALMLARIQSGAEFEEVQRAISDVQSEYEKMFWMAYDQVNRGDSVSAREIARSTLQSYPDKLDPLKIIALSYLQERDWEKAVPAFQEVEQRSPGDPLAMKNLVTVQLAGGDKSGAAVTLDKYVQAYGSETDAVLFAYRQFLALDNTARAGEIIENAYSNKPNDPVLRRAIIYRRFMETDYNAVVSLLRGVEQIELESNLRLLEIAGLTYQRSGNSALAMKQFEKLTNSAPNYLRGQLLYAEALANLGDNRAAARVYSAAVALDPSNYDAAVRRIRFLISTQDLEEAQRALTALQENVGEKPGLINLQGHIDLFQGDLDSAVANLTRSFELKADPEAAIWLARAHIFRRDFPQALVALDGWLADHPEDRDVLMEKAGAYLSSNKEDQAIEVYQQVVTFHPDFIPALNNIAWLSRDKDPELALETANRAYQLAPENPAILDTLGYLQMQSGDKDSALAHLQRASELAPEDEAIQLHLAGGLLKTGQPDKARRIAAKLLADTSDEALRKQAEDLLASIR